jgi:hypothetical protein
VLQRRSQPTGHRPQLIGCWNGARNGLSAVEGTSGEHPQSSFRDEARRATLRRPVPSRPGRGPTISQEAGYRTAVPVRSSSRVGTFVGDMRCPDHSSWG